MNGQICFAVYLYKTVYRETTSGLEQAPCARRCFQSSRVQFLRGSLELTLAAHCKLNFEAKNTQKYCNFV